MFAGRCRTRLAAAFAAALAALAWSAPALADPPHLDLPANLTAVIDFRIVLTDGERSWTDGGFGRSRFGGGGDGVDVHAVPAEAELVWHGPIAWNVEGTLAAPYQDGQDQPVDLIEAYATWRPVPRGATRFSVRAGMFWPQVSLEHEGPAWQVADMITPSAINSWIGEEVKVVGVEGGATHPLGRRPAVRDARPVRLQRHRRHPARLPRLGAARPEDRRLQPPDAAAARPRHGRRPAALDDADARGRSPRRLLRPPRLPIRRAGHARSLLLRQSRRPGRLHRRSAMGLAHALPQRRRADRSRRRTPGCSPRR